MAILIFFHIKIKLTIKNDEKILRDKQNSSMFTDEPVSSERKHIDLFKRWIKIPTT